MRATVCCGRCGQPNRSLGIRKSSNFLPVKQVWIETGRQVDLHHVAFELSGEERPAEPPSKPSLSESEQGFAVFQILECSLPLFPRFGV